MPEESPGKGLSPGKVIYPYRHLEHSLVIQRVLKKPEESPGKVTP